MCSSLFVWPDWPRASLGVRVRARGARYRLRVRALGLEVLRLPAVKLACWFTWAGDPGLLVPRSGGDERGRERKGKGKEKRPLFKSRDPHLPGWEKNIFGYWFGRTESDLGWSNQPSCSYKKHQESSWNRARALSRWRPESKSTCKNWETWCRRWIFNWSFHFFQQPRKSFLPPIALR